MPVRTPASRGPRQHSPRKCAVHQLMAHSSRSSASSRLPATTGCFVRATCNHRRWGTARWQQVQAAAGQLAAEFHALGASSQGRRAYACSLPACMLPDCLRSTPAVTAGQKRTLQSCEKRTEQWGRRRTAAAQAQGSATSIAQLRACEAQQLVRQVDSASTPDVPQHWLCSMATRPYGKRALTC